MDKYQGRYLAHQFKKKEMLLKLISNRHSTRLFSDKSISQKILKELIRSTNFCPSSCDRKSIHIKVIDTRDDKSILGGLLVGGVGWIHRANKILLLFADPKAYKERLVFSSRFANFDRFPHISEIIMHHLSWCRTNEEVMVKIGSYSHASEIRENWYRDVWCAKDDNPQEFGPTNAWDYKLTQFYALPKELKDLLKKHNALL